MKSFSSAALLICLAVTLGCQNETHVSDVELPPAATAVKKVTNRVVEASCGQCQFGMGGSGCDLAVRIDGNSYYVDGTAIDDHGDAHAGDGMCNCVRQAKVTGQIKDDRFAVASFELLPLGKE